MSFPLSFSDISLWLGALAIILLVASELVSANSKHVMIIIRKRRLRAIALTLSTLFVIVVLIRIYVTLTQLPISP